MKAVSFLLFLLTLTGVSLAEEIITGKDGAEMALVPAGEFFMGTEDEELRGDAPLRAVYLDAFYMDRYEVTNRLFARFLNAAKPLEGRDGQRRLWVVLRNDIETEERNAWWPTEIFYELQEDRYAAFESFADNPVISVSWHAADAYCKWAGKRLPTEAEWEKAARGGLVKKDYPWGNEVPTGGVIFERRWTDNSVPSPTEKVGNYFPNGYGLYDMAGNVWEWCADWFSPSYYKRAPYKNPKGPDYGEKKVLRGGSWFNSAIIMRVATRNSSPPETLDDGMGFRCAMDAAPISWQAVPASQGLPAPISQGLAAPPVVGK